MTVIPVVLYHGSKPWSPAGLKFLEAVINYISQATEIETDKLVKSIAGITEKGEEIAMTTAERLRQEGFQTDVRNFD